MSIFQIVQMDPAAAKWLGFAKQQCKRLIDNGTKDFYREWTLEGMTVKAKSYGGTVKLWLVAGGGFRVLTYRPVYGGGKYYMAVGAKFVRESSTVELKLSDVLWADFYGTPPIWLGRPNDFKRAYLAAYPTYSADGVNLAATSIYNTANRKKVLLPGAVYPSSQPDPFILNSRPTILWHVYADAGMSYMLWDIQSGTTYLLTGITGRYIGIAVSDSVLWLLDGSRTKVIGCKFDAAAATFSQTDIGLPSTLNTGDFFLIAGPSACCFAHTTGAGSGLRAEILHMRNDFISTTKIVTRAEIDNVSGAAALGGTNARISIASISRNAYVTATGFSTSIYGDDGNIYVGQYNCRVGVTESSLVKLAEFSPYSNSYSVVTGKNIVGWNAAGVFYIADRTFSVKTSIACRYVYISVNALYAIGVGGSNLSVFYAGTWAQIASNFGSNYASAVFITPDVDFILYYTPSGTAKMLGVSDGRVVISVDLVATLVYSSYTYYAEKRMLLIADIAVVVDVGLPTMQVIQGSAITVSPAVGTSNTSYMDATRCPVTQDWVDDWVIQTRALQPAP